MKKFYYLFTIIAVFSFITVSCEKSDELVIQNKAAKVKCTTIQSGLIKDSTGNPIEVGYDDWGYNYQAFMFNGYYCDSYRDAAWCQDYKDVELIMKWNEAWMSNKDCDGDGLLDRHYGFDSFIGSGAWLTNHQKGTYLDDESNECRWSYFGKIIAAPLDAAVTDGVWYNSDGVEIGPVIWGQFAIIQDITNDACAGFKGVYYKSPDHAGFGGWK